MALYRWRSRSKFTILLMVIIVLIVVGERKKLTIGKIGELFLTPKACEEVGGDEKMDTRTTQEKNSESDIIREEHHSDKTVQENNEKAKVKEEQHDDKTVEKKNEKEEIHPDQKQRERETTKDKPETRVSKDSAPHLDRRYLMYVHWDLTGPNVQYGHFRKAVASALYSNRTLMMPYFWPIASHQENLRSEGRRVNETFDMSKLKQLIDFITPEEYNRECNHSMEALLVSKNGKPDLWERVVKHYSKVYTIEVSYPDIPVGTIQSLDDYDSVRCLGVLTPNWMRPPPYGASLELNANLTKIVIEHLVFKPDVQKAADQIIEKICDGQPYLALNWRNKSGEGCAPPRRCEEWQVQYLAELKKTAIQGTKNISKLMSDNNLKCIYVPVPFYSKLFLKLLSDGGVPNVISTEDIIPPKYPDVEKYKHDNYYWSMIEQEICIRSKIFVGWRHSSWIDLIFAKRKVKDDVSLYLEDVIKATANYIIL